MISSCNAQAGSEVVGHSPDGGLPFEWCPEGGNDATDGDADNENDIEPVDVLVPVLLCHGGLSDVRLLGVVGLVPDRLLRVRLGGSRGLAGEVGRVHGGHAGDRLMRRHLVWEVGVFMPRNWLLGCWS